MAQDYKQNNSLPEDLFRQLEKLASEKDLADGWPDTQLQLLKEAGFPAWNIAPEFGGVPVTARQMAEFYRDCSASCLTTAFILTQREAAITRIAASPHDSLKQRLLPAFARGEKFITVGISHLSTSRQHQNRPAVVAQRTDTGYILNGVVPWVTGGTKADQIVIGGTLENGDQILAAVDARQPELKMQNPLPLLALNGSQTGRIGVHDLQVSAEELLLPPQPGVMKAGGGGTGSLTTSLLAMGVALRAINGLKQEAEYRENLRTEVALLAEEWELIWQQVDTSFEIDFVAPEQFSQTIRRQANSLVLRSAQAYLTAVKGAGFVQGHPAERTVREAMFFLVWSCPAAVAAAAMKEFACSPGWS